MRLFRLPLYLRRQRRWFTGHRMPMIFAAGFALAALALTAAGIDAGRQLIAQDDPVALTDLALDRSFDSAAAAREITAALDSDDSDLARSFIELARDRSVAVDPALADKAAAAVVAASTTRHQAASFARGLVTGEPDDLASLAGTATGDLFVFGDIRDAAREGARLAAGQAADLTILGLAGVGIAITAGTYATLGAGAPMRAGVTVLKAARRTGQLTERMGSWLGRSLRQAVDWNALRRLVGLSDPALAANAAREAVKVEEAGGLMELAGNVGRIESRAGGRAALDGLRLAEGPRDVSRLARLAAAEGGKTRAIIKLVGRAAIVLTTSAFNLAWWLFSAILMLFGFAASCKRTVERLTERHLQRRRLRRALATLRAAQRVSVGQAVSAAA
jgi:hypothetical protein